MKKLLYTFLLLITFSCFANDSVNNESEAKSLNTVESTTLTVKANDGVIITADLYLTEDLSQPFILLFHQAGYSRGEYTEIAPILNSLGFNCIAIDQRSGDKVNDVINQTNIDAKSKNLPCQYIDALPDLEATVEYAMSEYKPETIIIWGSSYSSSLNFILASKYKETVDGLSCFAPGEYFTYEGKKIKDFSKELDIPVFITSAKNEHANWKEIYNSIPSGSKVYFLPEAEGKHGSKALWSSHENNQVYWEEVKLFLKLFK